MDTARRAYKRFIAAGRDEGYRGEFHRGPDDSRLLGEDDLAQAVLSRIGKEPSCPLTLQAIIEAVCKAYELEQEQPARASRQRRLRRARGVIAWLAATGTAALPPLTELTRRLARAMFARSAWLRRIERRVAADHRLFARG